MYHIKNDKRSIQSSIVIYKSLCRLMKCKDFRDITIKEVAKEGHIGRATFYRNFDSLDDVLRLKCDETFQELTGYLTNHSTPSHFEQNNDRTKFLNLFLHFFYSHSEIVELLIKSNQTFVLNENLDKLLGQLLAKSEKKDTLIWRNLDYFIALKSGEVINILILWIKNNKNIHPDDLTTLVIGQLRESLELQLF
ncbi:MAG: TetR/AcrR family transcriptional regulator [Turicibacter sp.]